MDDLISRQAAIDAVCEHGTDLERRGITVLSVANHKQATVDLLESLPSVQERKGHDTGESRWFHCSECGYGVFDVYLDDEQKYDLEYHYCPNCGAKMEGAEDD